MELRVGDVVGVDVVAFGLTFHHVGVIGRVTWRDGFVVSKSRLRGCVVEESFADFTAGASKYTLHEHVRGRLDDHEVARRAYARRGEAWTAWSNCEHFVREVHGLRSESPQLQDMIRRVGLTGIAALVALPIGGPMVAGVVGGTAAAVGLASRNP